MTTFDDRVRARETVYGAWSVTDDAVIVNRLARSGVDFVLLDMQHGETGEESLLGLHGIISGAGAAPVVRVRYLSADHIERAYDHGAAAVVVPNVDTVEQVRDAVACARYAPIGRRSIGPLVPGAHQLLLWAMIESVPAVEVIDDILAVPGLEGIIVGPGDLALSLDTTRDPDDPVLDQTIRKVLTAAHYARIPAGVYARDGEIAARYRALGAGIVLIGNDAVLLERAAKHNLAAAQQLFPDNYGDQ